MNIPDNTVVRLSQNNKPCPEIINMLYTPTLSVMKAIQDFITTNTVDVLGISPFKSFNSF